MTFEIARLVQLCDCVAVICLLAYLLTRSRFAGILTGQKNQISSILFMSVTGGLLYLYGILTGIELGPYVISIQVIGPVIAGLIAGPVSGILAGIIGIILGFGYGITIDLIEWGVTLVSGLIGGLFWWKNKNRNFQISHVFGMGIGIGCIQFFAGVRGVKPDFLDTGEVLEGIFDLFIPTIAGLCIFAFIINNFRTEEESNRRSYHMEGELLAARQIQLGALPARNARLVHLSIAATLTPASYVGGDLFDYQELDDQSLYFAIGDVSGKGVPAALLMSSTRMLLRSKLQSERDPCALVREINRSFLEDGDSMQFITLIVGIINQETGEVIYCNAGHPPPFIVQTSGITELESEGNLAAGVLEDEEFVCSITRLNPGEILLLVSDGITEEIQNNTMFGSEGIIRTVKNSIPLTPDSLVQELVNSVQSWMNELPLSDDCTILAIGYYPDIVRDKN